jgi:hypothetical protein
MTTLKQARQQLAAFGCTLSKHDGEYKVRIKGSKRGMGYYTDDIDDAVKTGELMGKNQEQWKNVLGFGGHGT